MKVLLCTQYFWPETFVINDLVPLLKQRGVTLTVLTGKPNYPEGNIFPGYRAGGILKERHQGNDIFRVPIFPRWRRSRAGLALNYLSFILSCLVFGGFLLRDFHYDLVFVYAPSPLLQALPAIRLARQKNAPLVVWVQDLWPESLTATGQVKSRWLLAFIESIVRRIYRASARILVPSRAFAGPVVTLAGDASKVRYYPNLYQPTVATSPSRRAAELAATLRDHFSIVFAGNLGTAQSLDTIIGAARELLAQPQIRIVLVGSGRLDLWLSQQRDTLGLTNLLLPGRFDPSDLPLIYEAAQGLLVALKPESAFRLTIPSKVQAYLAAGRPILASLDGEAARIIREADAGLCAEAGNSKDLAAAIRKLWKMSPGDRKRLGKNGRRYFDGHFAPELLADDLLSQFREVANAHQTKA